MDLAKAFVRLGAKVNVTDDIGNSPLHIATKKNQRDLIKYFIKMGTPLDIKNSNGMTAFHLAIRFFFSFILLNVDNNSLSV